MMYELSEALPDDAIVVDDSISNRGVMRHYFEASRRGDIVGVRGQSIGGGMGATMGTQCAHPDRKVFGIIGDGSAMMTVQALWTAANYGIAAVYLVCNNRSYRILKLNMNIHRQEILREEVDEGFEGYVGMDFPLPLNIAGIAEAIGIYGRTISDPEAIGPELISALDSGKPAVLDVVIDGRI